MKLVYFILLIMSFYSCSRMEEAEKERIRKCNRMSESIYRHHDEHLFPIEPLKFANREKYPWEHRYIGEIPKITKEYFRCRGSLEHPERKEEGKVYVDCGGNRKHGLPFKEGREFIYPTLIDLLNYVQERLEAKVYITSGYRCPVHNAYINSDRKNQLSKHQVGAVVDFYVLGYEDRPFEVVKQIMEFYREKNEQEFLPFRQLSFSRAIRKHPSWYNKEIAIHLYDREEGRDFDNRHPYPYISIELKYDRQTKAPVQYDWNNAHQGYIRY